MELPGLSAVKGTATKLNFLPGASSLVAFRGHGPPLPSRMQDSRIPNATLPANGVGDLQIKASGPALRLIFLSYDLRRVFRSYGFFCHNQCPTRDSQV